MTVQLTCPYCQFSKRIPKEKIPPGVTWATCPRCRQRFQFSPPETKPPPATEKILDKTEAGPATEDFEKQIEHGGPPWENRSDLGLWPAIYQTFKSALFYPNSLFKGMVHRSGISEPLAFGLLIGSLGSMFGLFWQILMLSGTIKKYGENFLGQFAIGIIFLLILVFIPLFVIASMFIYSGVLHVLLLLTKAGGNGFVATFRVVAYSQAAQAWSMVPFLGTWIGGFWQMIIQIVGLREIHETSFLRVIVAFLIPVFFVLFLAVGVVIAAFLIFLE